MTNQHDPENPHQIKVLIIDDDEATREILQRTLRKEGYHVISAADGSEGLRLAQALQPDLITLDVQMPDMDGWSVLSALKNNPNLADIPVVMVTIEDQQNLGYVLGASGYLGKPIERSRLIEMVNKFCKVESQRPLLVIEDEPDVRHVFKRFLAHEGWVIVEASDGKEGLHQVEAYNPQLILLDLMMPDMDGFEFIRVLRHMDSYKETPVIVVTAKVLSKEEQTLLKDTTQHIIYKSASTHEDILEAIQEFMRK